MNIIPIIVIFIYLTFCRNLYNYLSPNENAFGLIKNLSIYLKWINFRVDFFSRIEILEFSRGQNFANRGVLKVSRGQNFAKRVFI